MQPVGLPVVHRDPVRVELGGCIRRPRIKWRGLVLRALPRFAEQFGSGSLIEAGLVFPTKDANGFEQAQRAKSIGVRGVFGCLERYRYMRLRAEIVDLV